MPANKVNTTISKIVVMTFCHFRSTTSIRTAITRNLTSSVHHSIKFVVTLYLYPLVLQSTMMQLWRINCVLTSIIVSVLWSTVLSNKNISGLFQTMFFLIKKTTTKSIKNMSKFNLNLQLWTSNWWIGELNKFVADLNPKSDVSNWRRGGIFLFWIEQFLMSFESFEFAVLKRFDCLVGCLFRPIRAHSARDAIAWLQCSSACDYDLQAKYPLLAQNWIILKEM